MSTETTIAENADTRQVVKFKVRRDGGHVKVRVFAGQENSPGLCGELTMRRDEWVLFRAHLDAHAVGKSQCQIVYEGDVRRWLAKVPDARVQEILDHLNSFVVREYEYETEIANGRVITVPKVAGADFNLGDAIEWALDQPEVSVTCGPDVNGAEVELRDGTILEFERDKAQWAVTISDEAVQP